jgi:sn-glycerol 3-phosphate transport system substrate-binding protein
VRLGNFVQIRTIVDEEMELVLERQEAPKEGLDDAVKRRHEQLERIERAANSDPRR